MLVAEVSDVAAQALGRRPACERAHVATVLLDGVVRPAVRLELEDEPVECVGDVHGVALELMLGVRDPRISVRSPSATPA